MFFKRKIFGCTLCCCVTPSLILNSAVASCDDISSSLTLLKMTEDCAANNSAVKLCDTDSANLKSNVIEEDNSVVDSNEEECAEDGSKKEFDIVDTDEEDGSEEKLDISVLSLDSRDKTGDAFIEFTSKNQDFTDADGNRNLSGNRANVSNPKPNLAKNVLLGLGGSLGVSTACAVPFLIKSSGNNLGEIVTVINNEDDVNSKSKQGQRQEQEQEQEQENGNNNIHNDDEDDSGEEDVMKNKSDNNNNSSKKTTVALVIGAILFVMVAVVLCVRKYFKSKKQSSLSVGNKDALIEYAGLNHYGTNNLLDNPIKVYEEKEKFDFENAEAVQKVNKTVEDFMEPKDEEKVDGWFTPGDYSPFGWKKDENYKSRVEEEKIHSNKVLKLEDKKDEFIEDGDEDGNENENENESEIEDEAKDLVNVESEGDYAEPKYNLGNIRSEYRFYYNRDDKWHRKRWRWTKYGGEFYYDNRKNEGMPKNVAENHSYIWDPIKPTKECQKSKC